MTDVDAYNDIHRTLDELGAPRGSTTSMRIRGLHRELTDAAAKSLAAARAGFDTAMAAVVAERDEVIRQRGEALGRVGATVAVLDETRWRETQQKSRAEAAEKRETEALAALNAAEDALTDAAITDAESLPDRIRELATRAAKYKGALVGATDEITALDRALSAAGLPTAETLAGRVAGLQLTRAEALSEVRALATERDNCREVLRREREERAAEKATMGKALTKLRAETDELGESVDSLRAENERLAAQLEFAERVLIAGIRRAIP